MDKLIKKDSKSPNIEFISRQVANFLPSKIVTSNNIFSSQGTSSMIHKNHRVALNNKIATGLTLFLGGLSLLVYSTGFCLYHAKQVRDKRTIEMKNPPVDLKLTERADTIRDSMNIEVKENQILT